jgi:hypothetical protein
MLDRNRLYAHNVRGGARVSHGPRTLARPKAAATASTFNGIYMRPNPSSTGTIPAQGSLCDSPDIWIAGTTPVANYQTALATSQSYGTSSSNNVSVGYDNYIYVRGLNGAQTTVSNTVELFYVPNAAIPWPSQWQGNVINTDAGNGTSIANITNLAPGAIGVADATFLWSNVQPPPSGSDHYCLIAWLNTSNNSNPFPAIYTQLDMSALIMNNLAWGWRNTVEVSSNLPTWSYQMGLSIPLNISTTAQYYVFVNPTGFVGWSVAFNCSQTDAKGNPIQLVETPIQQNGALLGTTCVLEPGFNATVTISMYSNGKSSSAGATIPLGCTYQSTVSEVDEVMKRNLVDWRLMRLMKKSLENSQIGPTPWTPLGFQPYTIAPTTSNVYANDPAQARRGKKGK